MQLEFNKGLPEHPEQKGTVSIYPNHLLAATHFKPIPIKGVDYAHHIRISQPTKPFRRPWYPF